MSRKIGVNERCPCGSGKKYKKCCLVKHRNTERWARKRIQYSGPDLGRLAIMRYGQELKEKPDLLESYLKVLKKADEKGLIDKADFEEYLLGLIDIESVRKMDTEDIISKLGDMNVEFSVEGFKAQSQRYLSAIQLAEEHYYTLDFEADTPNDEDFIWLAMIVLWERLKPDDYNVEMLDDEMQAGYKALDDDRIEDCIGRWEKAWEIIKKIIPPYIQDVKVVDDFMPVSLNQFVINWCQDFEMELHNAGSQDESYFKKRIEYCNEFCRIFPDTHDQTIQNMLRAEAESYAELGDIETADKLFEELVDKYPDCIWGYVGWGDMYMRTKFIDKGLPNYEKAEEIYLMGLAKCDYEEDEINDRLEDLQRIMNENYGIK